MHFQTCSGRYILLSADKSGESAMSEHTNRIGLTTRQSVIAMVIGAVLWLFAAVVLGALAPSGIYEGSARVWLYLLLIPITVPFIPALRIIAGLPHDKTGIAVALATATAMLLDGMALAWFPGLYGGTPAYVAGAGAAILWGAGVAVMLGFAFTRKV
jgi:hypothetical protein